jgi:hypothetical protein
MEKISMKKLYSELAYYKMLINSNYGVGSKSTTNTNKSMLNKAYQLRIRIITIKMRKNKIKKIFNL